MSIKVNLPSGGVCSVIGLTGSLPGNVWFGTATAGQVLTGSVGGPGVAGSPGIPAEYKEYMFLCKKDYGFKTGNYITMLLNSHLFGALHLKSKDSSMNFSISKSQLDEHFIWGTELRDKHIGDILNN